MDLLTEYNHFMWECNHLAHRSPENKRNVGICWAKSLIGLKLNATYTNIMQHSPTWCTNERNMLYPTCWRNMLRSFARALTLKKNFVFFSPCSIHLAFERSTTPAVLYSMIVSSSFRFFSNSCFTFSVTERASSFSKVSI